MTEKTTLECVWHQEGEGEYTWYTDCNQVFTLEDGTPESNAFQYCCFCGSKLVGLEWEEPEDEDEDEDEDGEE